MTSFCIIGYPLGHSFSAQYFTEKFEREGIAGHEYHKCELTDIAMLPEMIRNTPTLRGFNVTIPYKQAVIPYLDALDSSAEAVGAVNCVKVGRDGKLTGYNTDAYGFEGSLLNLIGDQRPAALILGTGGASKAVAYILRKLGIDYAVVSRTPDAATGSNVAVMSYDEVTPAVIAARPLIVNATPVGTFPNTDQAPALPYQAMGPETFLFDVVYNPPVSKFLALGVAQGASIRNGSEMLFGQAEKAWEIWSKED